MTLTHYPGISKLVYNKAPPAWSDPLSIEKDYRQKIRVSNEKCLKAMYKYGMKEVKMTPTELDVLKKRVMPVWDEFAAKGYYSKAELAEIKGLLAEYRSKKKK
ncbi:MAG: hypothetical protein PHV90_10515 [Smithella sp.]|nr:hypothetical protein [Smithella sp.]